MEYLKKLLYNLKKIFLKIFFIFFFRTLIKYVDNCLFFFKNITIKNTFVDTFFFQIGYLKRRFIRNKRILKINPFIKREKIFGGELRNNDDPFGYVQNKYGISKKAKKKPFLKRRLYTFEHKIEKLEKEDITDYSIFFDSTPNYPSYKLFFSLNRGFHRIYNFYYYYFNDFFNPTTFFFELFKNNRKFYYRFNIFPRKKRKQRIINYHIFFFKKYYYFLMLKKFIFHFLIYNLILIIFVHNYMLSFLIILLIFFNPFFFFFYKYLIDFTLKKFILGLKLNIYKNYNQDISLYFINGFMNTKFDKIYPFLNKEKEINKMKQILKAEIYKIFYLLNLKKNIKNNFKNYYIINNFRNLNKKLYKKLIKNKIFFSFDKIILKKILFLISFLYNWKTFSIFKLLELKKYKKRQLYQYKVRGFIRSLKGGFENIYGVLNTLYFWNRNNKRKNLIENELYYVGKKAKRMSRYLNLKKIYLTEAYELTTFVYILELIRLEKKRRELFALEFFKSKFLKKKVIDIFSFFFSSFNFKIVNKTKYELEKMFFFYNKKGFQENLNLNLFNYEINFFFLFFRDKIIINEIIFSDYIFFNFNFIYPLKENKNISIEKYLFLIEQEKKIFLMEKYLNNFDIFIDDLLFQYLIKFSQDNKDVLINENKEYFELIRQFKNYLKIARIENYNINDFKYYINDKQDPLLIFIELFSEEYLRKYNTYKKKEFFLENNMKSYNIRHFSNLFKKKYNYFLAKNKVPLDNKYYFFLNKLYPKLIEIFYKESSKKEK